ncbi:MAG: AAA family ATPase [Candidatus Aminicenantes bacterium]|nr:AAA family ATPase [Candidatus Aminicenantes bacterium]
MKTKKLPIGISDFKEIVTGNYCYVDKTLFIKEILDKGDKIFLIPRPRRFGKTLNLSMVKYFFDCCPTETPGGAEQNHEELFTPFLIRRAGGEYLRGQGKHPVIFISFRNIKELDWNSCWSKIKQLVQGEYLKHDYLLDSAKLKPSEKKYFKKIIDLTGGKGDYENSLEKLLFYLTRFYDRKAVILVDEYDAPIHAGFSHDYYEEIVNFMRNFLGGGLKDTDRYVEKGIISGIMRVAKESIFSGLNNLGVYTLTSAEFDDYFGFTEKEVEALLKDFALLDRYAEVQRWYNGYLFGDKVIYNPWSIINFLGNKQKELKPYWINTSDNRIVETLLSKGGKELKEELEQLIRGEQIEKAVEENIVLKDIFSNEDTLWSFLLMGGYLRQSFSRKDDVFEKVYYTLSIPNKEVRAAYTKVVDRYFSTKIENKKLETMLNALLAGDIDVFEEIFSDYVMKAMSFFDTAAEPEKVYHAFVMGLFLWLSPGYEVKSNRESGYGRYDIMIIPGDKNKLGFIIEFKKTRKKETLESAVQSALSQIEEKKYETELVERGIKNIKKLAIVFRGKDVYVKEADGIRNL